MPDSWDFNQPVAGNQKPANIPIITYLLIFLCVLFTAASATGADSTIPAWHRLYGLTQYTIPERVWGGQYWAYLPCMFVHADPRRNPMHILFNMLWLYQLGTLMERTMHPLAYAGFIALAGIVSGGCEIMWSNGNDVGVGFSGVVYAMFGLAWMGRYRHPTWKAIANVPNMQIMVVWAFGCWLATYLHYFGIANGAHFGGFALGLSMGWLVYGNRLKILAIVPTSAIIVAAVIGSTWMPWSDQWLTFKAGQAFDQHRYASAISYYRRCIDHKFDPATSWSNIAACWHNMGVSAYYKKDYSDMNFDWQMETQANAQMEKLQLATNAGASK